MSLLVVGLSKSRFLHHVVAALHIYPMSEAVLGRFPLNRRVKSGGLVYRITSLDQFSIESELFVREVYSSALYAGAVETFIDLGCNAGWFAVWLSSSQPNVRCRGLLVDAHPRMVVEAAWHLKRNGLSRCTVIHGAVGMGANVHSTTFNLHPSSSASSVLPYQPGKQHPVKGRIKTVLVPAISVAAKWRSLFGNAGVDLLKVDIEGKELDLFLNEAAFLTRYVRRIVVEYHKWVVSLDKLDRQLNSSGFKRSGVYDENHLTGIAVYENCDRVQN